MNKSEREKTNILLDKDLKKMLRKASFLTEESMADIVNKLLRNPLIEYLKTLED